MNATDLALRNAAVMRSAQAAYDSRSDDADFPDDFSDRLTEAEASDQAEDECMSDGYALAWAIQSICLDTPLGCATHDELHGTEYLSDKPAQTLLAILLNGNDGNSRIARVVLRDRILACGPMREAIRERKAELLRDGSVE